MTTVPEASVLTNSASKHPLWSVDIERSLVEESMLTTIYCNGCKFSEKAFFRDKSDKCPECKAKLSVGTTNQRNAVVGDKTEAFSLRLLEHVTKSLRSQLEIDLFAKRKVICPELGFTGHSQADLAILTEDLDGRVPASAIACLFEVKMSFIWNWKKKDLSKPFADYDGCSGRPSIFRTDSILKAIGKAAITRGYPGGNKIPFLVVVNTPPPSKEYRESLGKTVESGLIQRWISLTPNPLVVKPHVSPDTRNPKFSPGFLRIDEVSELQSLLAELLARNLHYVSAMVEAEEIGRLIKSLDLRETPEKIGQEFLQRLPEASISTEL